MSLTQKLKSELPGQTATKACPSRLGDIAEHWVCLLAAWKGAEVYKNLNCTGKTDIILALDGGVYSIDVKLARPSGTGWHGNTNRVAKGVIPVLVIPIGDITQWRVQWIRNRFPPELKNFWAKADHPLTYRETKTTPAQN